MHKLSVASLALLAAVGCKKHDNPNPAPAAGTAQPTEAQKPAEPAPAPAPAAPAAAAPAPEAAAKPAGEPHPAPAWLKGVEEKPTAAKEGSFAWVFRGNAFDSEDSARIDVDQVSKIDGNFVTTQPLAWLSSGPKMWHHDLDKNEKPYGHLPGGLVIPAHTVDDVKPKVGDLVFAYIGNTPAPLLVKVKAVDAGLVTFDQVNAMGDKTDERKTDIVEPYGKGLAPFTLATFKDGDDQKLMTVLAVDGGKVIGYDGSTKLVQLDKGKVKSLKPELKSRKVGDKVYAFTQGGDGKADVIKTVKIPDLSYEVGYSLVTAPYIFDKAP